MNKKQPQDDSYADGDRSGMTLGDFVGILIDSTNTQEAVIVRVLKETKPQNGQFTRTWELTQVPNGQVREQLEINNVDRVTKRLHLLLHKDHMH
jgi:hypothetical protein